MVLKANPNILIVLLGALGDVARGLAVVDALKTAKPQARIAWLVESKSLDLVKLHPRIDEIIVFERAKGLSAAIASVKQLRAFNPDICLDMQRHLKSGFFSFSSGAGLRVGFNPQDCKEFNFYFNNKYLPALGDKNSKLLHYLHFVESLGLASASEIFENRVSFGYCEHEPQQLLHKKIEIFQQLNSSSRKLVGVGLGTTWESKNYPLAGYLELVKRIAEDSQPVLLGDKSQAALAAQIAEAVPQSINLSAKINLSELLGCIKLLKAYVGPDSGPTHMAAACGVPCVTLFGPTDPDRVAPYKNEHHSLRAQIACAGCYRKVCPGLDTICMRLLDPATIAEKIREL